MRIVRFALYTLLVFSGTSTAWAQYGLYGSPEMLSMPQAQQQATQPYAAPANYPATAAPATQPVAQPVTQPVTQPVAQPAAQPASTPAYYPTPSPAYYPPAQPPYRYPASTQAYYPPAQPPYRYPAQPPAMYQPYQPAAQYQYPVRPPVRTAAIEPTAIQPMPMPPTLPAATGVAVPPAAPAPQGSGMMNQMLAEQGGPGCYGANGCYGGGAYRGAVGQYEQSACGQDYGYDGCGGQGYYCCPWYGSVSALVMGRSDARRVWTSAVDQHPEIQLSNTQINMPWEWGGEARLGHRFCCGCTPYAVEATFWTTEAMSACQTTVCPPGYDGLVSSALPTDNVYFDIGGIYGRKWANDIFNGSSSETVSRQDQFYNFEINLIREQLAWACDSGWDIGWSVGVRYFRFQESLAFSATSEFGDMDGYFKDTVTDNLVGVQFGFDAAYNVANCVRLFITPKVGLYGNFLDSTFDAKGRCGAGNYVNGCSSVLGYPGFPAHGTTTGVAFLTQIDVGADWQFTRCWSARAGYRVVAITGMGLADDQFPEYLCDTQEMSNSPQHYSSLVLHGAFLGATYCF